MQQLGRSCLGAQGSAEPGAALNPDVPPRGSGEGGGRPRGSASQPRPSAGLPASPGGGTCPDHGSTMPGGGAGAGTSGTARQYNGAPEPGPEHSGRYDQQYDQRYDQRYGSTHRSPAGKRTAVYSAVYRGAGGTLGRKKSDPWFGGTAGRSPAVPLRLALFAALSCCCRCTHETARHLSSLTDDLLGPPSPGGILPDPEPEPEPSAALLRHVLYAALVVLLIAGATSIYLGLGLHTQLLVSMTRMTLQVLAFGYLLSPAFSYNSLWPTLLLSLGMVAVATLETSSRPPFAYAGMQQHILAAYGSATALIVSYCMLVVLPAWRSQQYILPLVGLLVGEMIHGVGLGLTALLQECVAGSERMELMLALGASRTEATASLVQLSLGAAFQPIMNQMHLIGMVGMPCVMAGLIMQGADPIQASRLQLCVTLLACAATAAASIIAILLAARTIINERHQMVLMVLMQRQHAEGLLPMVWHELRLWLGALQRLALRLYFSCCRGRPSRRGLSSSAGGGGRGGGGSTDEMRHLLHPSRSEAGPGPGPSSRPGPPPPPLPRGPAPARASRYLWSQAWSGWAGRGRPPGASPTPAGAASWRAASSPRTAAGTCTPPAAT